MNRNIILCTFLITLNFVLLDGKMKRTKYSKENMLTAEEVRPYMFTEEIDGFLSVLKPIQNLSKLATQQYYQIQMISMQQQMLPKAFPTTRIYAYSGQTQTGSYSGFPGPCIMVQQNITTRIKFRNSIEGVHILPVDMNYPFNSSDIFSKQVPTVPHAHGLATKSSSDGQPQAFWTASGYKSKSYSTQQPCASNEAVYIYYNDKQLGNFWYHDHTIGITRLNVYAGLAGFYKILDPTSTQQAKLAALMGSSYTSQSQSKFFIISQRSFYKDGSLFYPNSTDNPSYTSWVPQFYGNMLVVNGKVWPKINLQKKIHRIVILNACQCRYLNIFFLNDAQKIPFQLLRADGDYYPTSIITYDFLLSLSSRIQILLDLTNINGQVIMKNDAQAPYPDGDPENLVDQFTGTILKIIIDGNLQKQEVTLINSQKNYPIYSELNGNLTYPYWNKGIQINTVLVEILNAEEQSDAMFIDGVPMKNGELCSNQTFKLNQTYDFYVINLTPDMHPIHFHLINMQKVMEIPIDAEKYSDQWFKINDGSPGRQGYSKQPIIMDPMSYQKGRISYPLEKQKIFQDTIDAKPDSVTVIRMRFAHNDGSQFIFAANTRYVWHCHMLQHEDNQMMRYFCLE